MIFIFDDKNEPADIFADIPSEKPGAPAPLPTGTTPLAVGESGVILERAPFGKKWVIVLLALLLVGGGAAAFLLTRGGEAPEAPLAPAAPAPEPQPEPQPRPEPEPAPAPEPPAVDSDNDGLSDAQEGVVGTNPNLIDSDADGLSDREEIQTYETDPLNPDTDADGFADGEEVRNGYNPKGEGRLQVIPTAAP
jgi:hypothetical protein